jgi:hypothetical protein
MFIQNDEVSSKLNMIIKMMTQKWINIVYRVKQKTPSLCQNRQSRSDKSMLTGAVYSKSKSAAPF